MVYGTLKQIGGFIFVDTRSTAADLTCISAGRMAPVAAAGPRSGDARQGRGNETLRSSKTNGGRKLVASRSATTATTAAGNSAEEAIGRRMVEGTIDLS